MATMATMLSSASALLVVCALLIAPLHGLPLSETIVSLESDGVTINVDKSTGNFTLSIDGQQWFSSGPVAVRNNSRTLTNANSSLVVTDSKIGGGSDPVGKYESIELTWNDGAFVTTFKSYFDAATIVFEQSFPHGATATATGSNTDVVSNFPSFGAVASGVDLNYLTYQGVMSNPAMGRWGGSSAFPGGVNGGQPLVLYNQALSTVVISPLDNFMVGAQTVSDQFPGCLSCGLNGKILQVPVNFTFATVLVAGHGINSTMYNWGGSLLQRHGKGRTSLGADRAIMQLGYWTDNGAYYYYHTESNKNYEQTMIDVKAYLKSINVPAQYFQYDSWWYFKGPQGAVTDWEPMPSVFPDGMSPKWMDNEPLILHNRYFSPASVYAKNYTFLTEEGAKCALPVDEAMFEHIMGLAKDWGMFMYEQDWLVTVYQDMELTQNNVSNSRTWLMAMGNAAHKLDLTIQYCMPLPIFMLQSVEIPTVTNARASGDYHPGTSQWHIGMTSLFYWSIGIVPFKDNFWSTTVQPGNPYGDQTTEPNVVLQALVATLSTGPVGPSDSLGHMNHDLVMRTCAADGLILKPDKPATPLDAVFEQGFANASAARVWDTFADFSGYRWHYLLAAELTAPFTVSTSDLGLSSSGKFVAYNWFDASDRTTFDSTHPLQLKPNSTSRATLDLFSGSGHYLQSLGDDKVVDFSYTNVAPVLPNGWTLLGESAKFVTMSHQRVKRLQVGGSAFNVVLSGTNGEEVAVHVLDPSGKDLITMCQIGSRGMALLACQAGPGCKCASAAEEL